MDAWLAAGVVLAGLCSVAGIGLVVWWRRSGRPSAAAAELRALSADLVRLPGRLRRVAADPRTPRRARWWLIALAIYVASPIDPLPDVLPGLGHLDELRAHCRPPGGGPRAAHDPTRGLARAQGNRT
jgi:hypothetical protein